MASEWIDSHHHLWRYSEQEFGWVSREMGVLRRDFLPQDIQIELRSTGIAGAVTVQARQSVEETEWLLAQAGANDFLLGVVGWVPLTSLSAAEHLERLAANPKLKGVRHVVQDEPDSNFLLRKDFNAGIGLLAQFGLVYDILIFERHLAQAIEFVDRHPNQVFVLDHVAKPRIREGLLQPWRERIHDLARRPNVYCKLSGMATEAEWAGWTEEQLRPYFETVLDAFGPNRLMFGSDWPVLLLASDYARWLATVLGFVLPLTPEERESVLGGTAKEVYHL